MVLTALAAAATTKAATTATAAIITGATAVPGTPPSAGACARAGRHWLSGRRAFLFSTLLRHRLLLAILLLAICEVGPGDRPGDRAGDDTGSHWLNGPGLA